ncbi:MAG TPA: hypothetical protein VHX44_09860 [Planctomycetota bacterium]|jgi:GrpB-like predicted nucleotidyltransferase (UPF0157 family)|nr:hypothetical protein [Planctomycetota bacterium]
MDFADELAKALASAGYNPFSFAKRVKTSQGRVRDIITRRREGRAPLEVVDAWADALKLEGKAREVFLRAAYLSHTPPEIAEDYLRLRARVDKLEKRVAEFEEKNKP